MEIERRFLINKLPENLSDYPASQITQRYIFFEPTVRIREQDGKHILTVKTAKTKDGLVRNEFEVNLSKREFENMSLKTQGHTISKTRYKIPLNNNIICELDMFHDMFKPLIIAEAEFGSVEEAEDFVPPSWFGREVTSDKRYSNSSLSESGKLPELV